MQRLLSIVLIFTISICVLPAVATAQAGKSIPADVIQQLLNRPALPFGVSRSLRDDQENGPEDSFSNPTPPPDDAPIDDILSFWFERAPYNRDNKKPSTATKLRLLEECEKNPLELDRLLPFMPDSPEAQERIKNLFDAEKSSSIWGPSWQRSVEEWLRLNSVFYIDDLIAVASKAKDSPDGTIRNETELTALARLEWKSATTVLQNLANSNQPITSAFAKSLLYKHAIETGDSSQTEEYRTALISIAESAASDTSARTRAAKVLVATEWNSRDDWYLSMLRNGSLWDLQPGQEGSPLFTPISRDPDKWIPVMIELLGSKDADLHNSAAASLAQLEPGKARVDSILPLLPWLMDEKWADAVGPGRANLIRNLRTIQVPESIPGLIRLATKEGDYDDRTGPVETLAEYKDPRVVPALKIALEKETRTSVKSAIIKSLIASGGLSDQEMTDDLEACVRVSTCESRPVKSEGDIEPAGVPTNVLIGLFISNRFQPSDLFSRKVLDRINTLQETDPEIARQLLTIAQKWQTHSTSVDMVRRVGGGRADAKMIEIAIFRAKKLRESAVNELAALTELKGVNRAIGLVLIDDDPGMQDVLVGSDKDSIISVLACARLAGKSLPINLVSDLFRRNDEKLSAASDRYLEAEDGIDARHVLWSRHADQSLILGWKASSAAANGSDGGPFAQEKALRAEVLKDGGPTEIIGYFPDFLPGGFIARFWNDRAVLTVTEAKDRYKEWQLIPSQVKDIRDYISTTNLDQTRSTFSGCLERCMSFELVDIVREKGWRITQQFTGGASGRFPDLVIGLLLHLVRRAKEDDYKVGYVSAKEIAGLEVLFADDKRPVSAIWKQGQDFRLQIQKNVDPEELYAQRKSLDDGDVQKSPEEIRKEQRLLLEMERGQFTWYKFRDGKLGETTVSPQELIETEVNSQSIDPLKFPKYQNSSLRQATAGNVTVLASSGDGLWKKVGEQPPVQIIAEGAFSNVVVEPAGHWAIALKEVGGGEMATITVRVNLQTGKEYKVTFANGEPLVPIQYLASRDRVLVSRQIYNQFKSSESSYEEMREYLLVQLSTGRVQSANGDFRPFLHQGDRFRQSTGRPDEVWVAFPDQTAERTEVGRYNTRTFKFERLITIPKFVFDSSNMWVDESEGRLYLTNRGDLLRLPLPAFSK